MKPTTRDWLEIATEDLDTAQAMCAGGRYLYAGFAAQESAEKALWAAIQEGARVPPKIHDLETLAERAGLDDAALGGRLRILSLYYRGARYPAERAPLRRSTDEAMAVALMGTAREVLAWATGRVSSTTS